MIRNGVKSDEEGVFRLIAQLSQQEFTRSQFNECFAFHLNHHQILVVEEDGAVRGCIVLHLHFPLHFSQRVMEIANLIIDEKMRGKGLGAELLKQAERIAYQAGCARIEVDSGNWRKDAHRFYQREGFSPTHLKLTKALKGAADA